MNKTKIISSILAMAFGVFMVVFGERDDSPGAQMLGLILFVGGIVSLVRGWRKSRSSQTL